ncbi:MAG: tRNA lysidine(34) synthetase TilS [Myxococcales bacterium]|nr:tRNA lysidine(34) synthetase TilS [Myxococcales bacterium]
MGTVTESVEQAVASGLLPRGEPVLVACSGGADSVALAVAVQRCGLRGAIGHVDHALRPESAREADQVAALSVRLGAPFFVERLEGLRTRGPGLEAAAREARYSALVRLARAAGARVVATAHTRRDQAETLLLRLIRGAGPTALAGIRRRRPLAARIELVRPLLDVSREETEIYCRQNRLSYVEDPHNTDPARLRARLRKLWPQLLELNPRLEAALAGAAALLAEENEVLESLPPESHPALQRRALLKHAVEAGVHPERMHLEQLIALLAKGRGQLDLPGGRATVRDGAVEYGRQPVADSRQPASLAVARPGRYAWSSRELEVTAGRGEGLVVDLSRAPFPWTLRTHRPGDRFRPAGGRTKKVSDLWIDARVPREERASMALLEDGQGRLFWVEGLRPGEPARGDIAHPATFRLRPEMKPFDARLTSRRKSVPRSATMTRSRKADEEPR